MEDVKTVIATKFDWEQLDKSEKIEKWYFLDFSN